MNTFRVYAHPTRGHDPVKVGFSWPALYFGLFWMLVKRLWTLAGLLSLALIALQLIERVTDAASSEPGAQALAYFILAGSYLAAWLVPAFKGNAWRESNLVSRGYEFIAEVRAETSDAAIAMAARPLKHKTSQATRPKVPREASYALQHRENAGESESVAVDLSTVLPSPERGGTTLQRCQSCGTLTTAILCPSCAPRQHGTV